MMRYASPLIIVGFAGMVNEMLSRTMMREYLLTGTYEENMAQLGVFGANYKLAMLITLFTQAYRYAAEPFFFRHAADENAMQTQSEVTKWFTITAAVGMLGILLFLDIVKHFLGKDFHSGVGVVPIFALRQFAVVRHLLQFFCLVQIERPNRSRHWISLGGAGITIVLNILWIPTFGYVGAAWSYANLLFVYVLGDLANREKKLSGSLSNGQDGLVNYVLRHRIVVDHPTRTCFTFEYVMD
ncbi:MAG: hypothetical protein R2778_14815 [Saprospiraceae bacterium]